MQSVEDANESLFTEIKESFLVGTLREMLSSPCIPISSLYNTVHAYSYAECTDDDMLLYERSIEVKRSNRKLTVMLESLLTANDPKSSGIFVKDKIYDKELQAAMRNSYNAVAELLGVPELQFDLSEQFMKRFDVEDDEYNNHEKVSYEDALALDRHLMMQAGINPPLKKREAEKLFLHEYVLLSCLMISLKGRNINALNKPLDSPGKRERGVARLRHIRDTMMSGLFYDLIAVEIFFFLEMLTSDEYSELRENHLRTYWLDEKYRNLKYLSYAEEKKRFRRTALWPEMSESEEQEKTKDFNAQYRQIQLYDLFFGKVSPVAEMILHGFIPRDLECGEEQVVTIRNVVRCTPWLTDDDRDSLRNTLGGIISAAEYSMALKTEKLIDALVEDVRKSSLGLLRAFQEAAISGEKDFFEYLMEK